jgi:Tfp pilus assembly protein PilN
VRRTRRLGKRTTWLIVAGAVPVLLAIGLYVWVLQRQSQLDGIEQTIAGMQKEVDEAKTVVDRMDYTRAYFDARPPLLECLREITLAYRDDEKIWTTSLSLRDEERRTEKDKKMPPVRKGTLQGKASDNNTVYAMLDRLRKNPKFAAVQMLKTTEVGGKSKDVVFSASFNFTATE